MAVLGREGLEAMADDAGKVGHSDDPTGGLPLISVPVGWSQMGNLARLCNLTTGAMPADVPDRRTLVLKTRDRVMCSRSKTRQASERLSQVRSIAWHLGRRRDWSCTAHHPGTWQPE